VWDATTGSNLLAYSPPYITDNVVTVAWSPYDTRIAFNINATVQIVDAATMGKIVSIACLGHTDQVSVVAWSPDGRYVASGSMDDTVRICNTTTGTNIDTYK